MRFGLGGDKTKLKTEAKQNKTSKDKKIQTKQTNNFTILRSSWSLAKEETE